MQGFIQNKSAYTADAKNITMTGVTVYDPNVLDNPMRKKINYALIASNDRNYREMLTL